MTITITEALTAEQMQAVWRLTHDEYVRMGYAAPQPDGLLRHYPHMDDLPETTVLIATDGQELIGTCSYTLDNPSGLHCDVDFPDDMRMLRRHARAVDAKLVAAWRIVVRSNRCGLRAVRQLQERVADDLWVTMQPQDILVCDFNPRHMRYYARLWGMHPISDRVSILSVGGAPAVLMIVTIERLLETHWKRTSK